MVLVLRRFTGQPLFVINADGSNLHQILAMPEFTATGSPDWSHDGSRIALDAWRSVFGENYVSAHVFVINADGSSPKDLGPGAMPSWSPDDKQLTYCQYAPENGVWIMNADGSGRQRLDPDGWGSQWSPKRNEIAYTIYENGRRKHLHLRRGQKTAPHAVGQGVPADLLGVHVVARRPRGSVSKGICPTAARNRRRCRRGREERIQDRVAQLGVARDRYGRLHDELGAGRATKSSSR